MEFRDWSRKRIKKLQAICNTNPERERRGRRWRHADQFFLNSPLYECSGFDVAKEEHLRLARRWRSGFVLGLAVAKGVLLSEGKGDGYVRGKT
jgi:hypothetical protein